MKYSSELMHTLILTDNEYLALHNAIKFYLSDEIQKVGNTWIVEELQSILKTTGDNQSFKTTVLSD